MSLTRFMRMALCVATFSALIVSVFAISAPVKGAVVTVPIATHFTWDAGKPVIKVACGWKKRRRCKNCWRRSFDSNCIVICAGCN
jgi:hypothetical protein